MPASSCGALRNELLMVGMGAFSEVSDITVDTLSVIEMIVHDKARTQFEMSDIYLGSYGVIYIVSALLSVVAIFDRCRMFRTLWGQKTVTSLQQVLPESTRRVDPIDDMRAMSTRVQAD